jgi:hypothetical protein
MITGSSLKDELTASRVGATGDDKRESEEVCEAQKEGAQT